MKKLKWERYKNDTFPDAYHMKVHDRTDSRTLRLAVWKRDGRWYYGAINWVYWGRTTDKAKAQALAISTCIELCANAGKVLEAGHAA
jgi:hypothetical protein